MAGGHQKVTINSLSCGLASDPAGTVGVGVAVGGGKGVTVAVGGGVSVAVVVGVFSIAISGAVGCTAWLVQPTVMFSSIKTDNANRLNILSATFMSFSSV